MFDRLRALWRKIFPLPCSHCGGSGVDRERDVWKLWGLHPFCLHCVGLMHQEDPQSLGSPYRTPTNPQSWIPDRVGHGGIVYWARRPSDYPPGFDEAGWMVCRADGSQSSLWCPYGIEATDEEIRRSFKYPQNVGRFDAIWFHRIFIWR